MFTSSVLNHSFRMSDPMSGGLHLNALNGSADALGYNNPSSDREASPPDNGYGGLFGVSLSDNHPYRPSDSGRSFQDSCTSGKYSPSREEESLKKNHRSISNVHHRENMGRDGPTGEVSGRALSPNARGRRRQYIFHRDTTDSLSPLSLRRYSLNTDTDRISTHAQCGSDLSLSLEEISTYRSDVLDEDRSAASSRTKNKNASSSSNRELELDVARLSISQVDIETPEISVSGHLKHKHHSGRRTKRLPTVETIPSASDSNRAVKILDKIKEGKKTETSSRSKQKTNISNSSSSTTREKSPRPQSSTSRHHITTYLTHVTHRERYDPSPSSSSSTKKDSRQRIQKPSAASRRGLD